MNQIKKGDNVRAHLDGSFMGKVVDVISEQHAAWSSQGPLGLEAFCLVQLEDGSVVKRRATDLYVDYE